MRQLEERDRLEISRIKGQAYGQLKGIQGFRPDDKDKIRTLQYRAWAAYYRCMQEECTKLGMLHASDVCRVAAQNIEKLINGEEEAQLCLPIPDST